MINGVREKMFFFPGSKGRRLLGFLHLPENNRPYETIIYCHPFAEEKNMSHSVIVHTSRVLAANGFGIFRFDLSGCGDSEGELEDMSIDDWIEDLKIAVKIGKEMTGNEKCGIWGLRLGAVLAVIHASRDSDISFLILWQGIADLKNYMHQFLRIAVGANILERKEKVSLAALMERIVKGDGVTIGGYKISQLLYNSFSKYDDFFQLSSRDARKLVISISLIPEKELLSKEFANILNKCGNLSDTAHVIAEPFWDRYWRDRCPEIEEVTLRWLKKYVTLGEQNGRGDQI